MCNCKIIPDIVLDELKKEGRIIVTRGGDSEEDKKFRKKRAAASKAKPKDLLP